jgi:hypothetical protein
VSRRPRPHQLGFDTLLAEAERANEQRKFAAETAHLLGTLNEAVPFYRDLIERHHAAMFAANTETVTNLRQGAHRLAVKLSYAS